MSKMDEVFDLVVRGKSKLIAAAVQEALDEGNAAPSARIAAAPARAHITAIFSSPASVRRTRKSLRW